MVYIYDTVSRHIIKSYSLCHSHTKYGVATYLPEGADPEAALRVHQEVPPEIVEHDGVPLAVLRELTPYHAQRLHLKARREKKGVIF